MHPFFRRSPIVRLSIRPDDPAAIVAPRPRGSRRPHPDTTVAAVRHYIEQTTLTYAEIEKRTGVARASICRWTQACGWRRPLFAPRATDTIPSARASAKLKARTLAARLQALAERAIRELESEARVELDKLAQALELLKMAKLAARPRRRRRASSTGDALDMMAEPARTRLIEDLRSAGVNVADVPESALADFFASLAPRHEPPFPRERGRYSRRNRAHAQMLEPIR